jgi:hypothetical protein
LCLSYLYCFFSFSCLIAMVKISSTILNESGKSWTPCLILDFRGNTFKFFHIQKNVGYKFLMNWLCYIEVWSLYPCFFQGFYHECMLNFLKGLFYIYWGDHVTFVLILFMCQTYIMNTNQLDHGAWFFFFFVRSNLTT